MAFKKGNIPWNKGIHTGIKSRGTTGMIAWNRGLKMPEEQKRKVSLSRKGKCLGDANPSKLPEVKMKISGENHYLWKKDRTQIVQYWTERNNPEYKQWRLKIYRRDNYKCRIDNCDCKGRIIAHHILSWTKFPELRYNINNGITLCQFHHPRRREDEQRLIPFFKSMVEVK
jgi:hypothetical protein